MTSTTARRRSRRRRSRRRGRSRQSGSQSAVGLGMAVAAVLVVALVVAVAGGDGDVVSGFDQAAIAAPSIEGEPVLADVGPAPTATGDALLTEGQVQVPVPGEPTMLVFLAHWCQHCNAELPVIEEWLDTAPPAVPVRAVATAIDPTRPNYPPDTWLGRRDWSIPTVVDGDGSIGAAFGIASYPAWVFVDADGVVVGRSGPTTVDELVAVADALARG